MKEPEICCDDELETGGGSIGRRSEQILCDFHLPEAPDHISLKEGQRVVAIGDIHGDFPLLINTLLASNLVDRQDFNWIGNDSIVVFVGDVFDKGYQEEKCLRLICRTAQQAHAVGGIVVVLWGNHESMNTESMFVCTVDEESFVDTFSAVVCEDDAVENDQNKNDGSPPVEKTAKRAKLDPIEIRAKVFANGGLLARAFLSKLKVAVRIGRSVFVHGGLIKDHLDYFGGGFQGIQSMNQAGMEWILSIDPGPPFLDCLDPPKYAPSSAVQGPQWMRDYSMPEELSESSKISVDDVLHCLDVDRIVVGHTEQRARGGVNSTYNDKVWRIDVGFGVCQYCSPFSSFLEDSDYLHNLALGITLNGGSEAVEIIRREDKWRHGFE